jgi:hypothetical protein
MIEFKLMASAHDSCSYHQAKTPIDFWCRRDLNPGLLLDDKRLYQMPLDYITIEVLDTVMLQMLWLLLIYTYAYEPKESI